MCGNIEGLESRRAALSSFPSLHHLSSHASLAHEGARRTVLLATCERPRKECTAKPLQGRDEKTLVPFCACATSQPTDPSLTIHNSHNQINFLHSCFLYLNLICAKSNTVQFNLTNLEYSVRKGRTIRAMSPLYCQSVNSVYRKTSISSLKSDTIFCDCWWKNSRLSHRVFLLFFPQLRKRQNFLIYISKTQPTALIIQVSGR